MYWKQLRFLSFFGKKSMKYNLTTYRFLAKSQCIASLIYSRDMRRVRVWCGWHFVMCRQSKYINVVDLWLCWWPRRCKLAKIEAVETRRRNRCWRWGVNKQSCATVGAKEQLLLAHVAESDDGPWSMLFHYSPWSKRYRREYLILGDRHK